MRGASAAAPAWHCNRLGSTARSVNAVAVTRPLADPAAPLLRRVAGNGELGGEALAERPRRGLLRCWLCTRLLLRLAVAGDGIHGE